MGKLLEEMDSVLMTNLTPTIEETFDMVPNKEGKYTVTFGKKNVCKLELVSKETNVKEAFETARRMPEEYIIYMTEIRDYNSATQYIELLDSMGFESVSIIEEPKGEQLIKEE